MVVVVEVLIIVFVKCNPGLPINVNISLSNYFIIGHPSDSVAPPSRPSEPCAAVSGWNGPGYLQLGWNTEGNYNIIIFALRLQGRVESLYSGHPWDSLKHPD